MSEEIVSRPYTLFTLRLTSTEHEPAYIIFLRNDKTGDISSISATRVRLRRSADETVNLTSVSFNT